MFEELKLMEKKATDELKKITDTNQLPEWFRAYLGKKGEVAQAMKKMGKLSADERPLFGKAVNDLKQSLQNTFDQYQVDLEQAEISQALEDETIDVSLPGRKPMVGHLHITTQMLRKIYSIMQGMGFQVYDSPEVETDVNNFQLLNIPEYHPARDMWDTFWVNDEVVLRTHTSPGQIRAMREFAPNPIRVVLPGKVYRYEEVTARSEHQFYQVEGLAIGQNIKMSDWIGVIHDFVHQMYDKDRKVRLRGSYFPFTEPSIEIDISCILCHGEGCRMCKYTGWLEIGGAGMIHPVVLENGGYSPEQWTGFAFGMGVERPAIQKHSIQDIRMFYNNDLNFLRQF